MERWGGMVKLRKLFTQNGEVEVAVIVLFFFQCHSKFSPLRSEYERYSVKIKLNGVFKIKKVRIICTKVFNGPVKRQTIPVLD